MNKYLIYIMEFRILRKNELSELSHELIGDKLIFSFKQFISPVLTPYHQKGNKDMIEGTFIHSGEEKELIVLSHKEDN